MWSPFCTPNRSKTLRGSSGSSFGIHFGPPNRPRSCVGDGLMVARAILRAQDTPKCHKEASSDLGNATRHLRRRLTKLQPLFESLPRCLKGFPRRLGLFQNPTCPKPKSRIQTPNSRIPKFHNPLQHPKSTIPNSSP